MWVQTRAAGEAVGVGRRGTLFSLGLRGRQRSRKQKLSDVGSGFILGLF